MHKIFRGLIACFVAATFFINSITLAGEINLAVGTKILDVLREARLYYSVIALHSELVSKNINNLRGLYLEMDRIIDGLVSAEKVKRGDIDKLKCLVFDSASGDKVYYYFREDGLFFRVARSPDIKDRYSNVLGLGQPVERKEIEIMDGGTNYLEVYRLDTERMDYIKKCLAVLYPEGIEDEAVEKAIDDIISKSPPEWMAQDYRAGYLLMKDVPETGGDSKDGKIKQAKDHLYKATNDPVIRKRVERLLDILRNHPKVDSLSLLQYEGIAHRLVKEYSGNPNAYKDYKERLDTSFSKIYGAIRDELSRIPNDKERLMLAMLYAGIGNLIDLSFPDALRRISDDLGIDVKDHLGLVKGVHKKIVTEGLIIEGDDFEKFFNNIKRMPDGLILYFLDNHGEAILDQLVIEELLKAGYRVAVVARGETVRDDVTVSEAGEILGRNSHLMEYLESGRLSVLTDGSYLLGADLSQSERYPEFLKAWQEASAYIAKGAGNFHTLLGQKLSIPGLHIRMMKGSKTPYERLSQLKGRPISKRSDYDLAFTYQYASLFDPKKRKPALPTGIGVVAAIKAAVAEAFPDAPDVRGKVVAVQGAGGTGASVIKQLLGLGAIVIASDISVDAINALRKEIKREGRDRFYYIVEEKDGDGYTRHIMNPRSVRSFTDTLMHIDAIGEGHVDVFSPCAIGPVLNPETIGELQQAGVKVVCGSCNNVLEDKTRDARLLMEAGITFVPDYIANFDEANEALLRRLEEVYRSEGPKRDDYYVAPIVAEGSAGVIKKGDTVIWINHRGDRSKAALEVFTNPGFNEHGNRFPPEDLGVNFVPFANYEPDTFRERGLIEVFPFKLPKYVTLSQALRVAGIIEGRFAESDKGQHTTYFFDGRRKVDYDREGIHVEIVPSENVPDRDKKPEMRCGEVADAAIRFVDEVSGRENGKFLFVNFATDIQGHNLDGDKERARRVVLATDEAVGRLREKIRELGGVLIVTADHGNVEEMALLDENGIPLRDEYGVIFSKQHTVQNPVPFIVEGLGNVKLKQGGTLANIAGTVLEILGIKKPEGMEDSLLEGYQYRGIKGPVVVVVRDGWGIARHNNPEADEWNAVKLANPPVDNDLIKTCPWTLLKAHGEAVGLPAYQMGDSDQGHTTIGAGRLVPTLYKDIIEQIEDGRFFTNPVLIETFQRAMRERQDIHISGLISDGGVHSDYRYVLAILEMAKSLGVDKAGINIYIHAILDGRDVQTRVPTQSGVYYLRKILEKAKKLGLNNIALADASGRHFGMDRDAINRDTKGRYEESQPLWQERFKVAYDAWVYGREPEKATQGSHIVRKAGEGVEVLIYRTGLEVLEDTVSITKPMSRGWYTGLNEYADSLRTELKKLLATYGPGIFTQVNEIQIVENLGAGDVYPDGRAPLASFKDGVLRIDELAFKYGEHLLFEELEHEFIESIAVLIPGATHALADVVSTFRNVKRFLELGTDEKEEFLGFLGDENPIDPDGEYLALLRRLSEIRDITEDEIIASVVRYVLRTKLYERVRGELGLPEELAGRIRDLEPRFDDALAVFNEIAGAKEGRELVDNVKSSGRLAIRVIETFRGIRISVTEVEQDVIETTILSLYPHEISWVREHSRRVARIAEIIAERMQLGTELIRLIRIAALAHDLGKGSSREMIEAVNSPGPKISEIIDRHREESLRMLEKAGIDMDDVVRQAILYHHDPWLTTDKYARIATEIIYLADQVDASQDVHRPYKKRPIDITLLLLEFRSHYKSGKISKPVYKAAHQLLTGIQPDFMDVIYDARGEEGISVEEINRRLSNLFDSLVNYKPEEQVLSLKWDEEINAVDLYYFYRYVSGLEGLGEGERTALIMRLLLAIVSSSLDIKGYDVMKPLSDLILFDGIGSDAMRSHAKEFRNNFDPSGEKSREIINLVSKIQDRVSGEMRQFVDDFKNRCGFLLIGRLLDYLKGYDKLSLPETPDITGPRYIVVSKDREKNRLEDILRQRYDIHIVTEIPKEGEFVVLVNPEDVGRWEGQDLLYLPLPYMEQSLKLAAGMLLADKRIAHNYVKDFYNILLGRNLSDEEVANLFHRPWWILPEISALATDLIILREAISQLEKSA